MRILVPLVRSPSVIGGSGVEDRSPLSPRDQSRSRQDWGLLAAAVDIAELSTRPLAYPPAHVSQQVPIQRGDRDLKTGTSWPSARARLSTWTQSTTRVQQPPDPGLPGPAVERRVRDARHPRGGHVTHSADRRAGGHGDPIRRTRMSRSQGRCRPEPAPFRPERHVADSDTFPRSRSSGWDGDLEPGGPIARTGPHGEQEAGARRARGALKGAPPGRQLGAGSQHGTEQATGTATAPPSPARDCPLSEPDQALARRPDGRVHSLQAGVLIAPIPAGTRSPSGQSAVAGSISTRAPGHRGHYRRHPPGDVHRRCGPDDLVDDLPTRESIYVRPVGHSCVDQHQGTRAQGHRGHNRRHSAD